MYIMVQTLNRKPSVAANVAGAGVIAADFGRPYWDINYDQAEVEISTEASGRPSVALQ